MMKTKLTLALVATLGAFALAAHAQDTNSPADGPPGGGRGGFHPHRPPPLPIILALDTNHDGVIDANEIANASAALLTLDKNGDGVLTTNEYLPSPPANAPQNAPRPPMPLIVKALDANGDGVIDANEIANAPAALKSLDKNGDGRLTKVEVMGPRPPMHDGCPGGQGHGGGDSMPPDGPPPGDEGDGNNPPPDAPPAED
jgi:hypothetical protein